MKKPIWPRQTQTQSRQIAQNNKVLEEHSRAQPQLVKIVLEMINEEGEMIMVGVELT